MDSTPYTPRAVYDRLKVRSLEVTQELLMAPALRATLQGPGLTVATPTEAQDRAMQEAAAAVAEAQDRAALAQAQATQAQTDAAQAQDRATQAQAQAAQMQGQMEALQQQLVALQQHVAALQQNLTDLATQCQGLLEAQAQDRAQAAEDRAEARERLVELAQDLQQRLPAVAAPDNTSDNIHLLCLTTGAQQDGPRWQPADVVYRQTIKPLVEADFEAE